MRTICELVLDTHFYFHDQLPVFMSDVWHFNSVFETLIPLLLIIMFIYIYSLFRFGLGFLVTG